MRRLFAGIRSLHSDFTIAVDCARVMSASIVLYCIL